MSPPTHEQVMSSLEQANRTRRAMVRAHREIHRAGADARRTGASCDLLADMFEREDERLAPARAADAVGWCWRVGPKISAWLLTGAGIVNGAGMVSHERRVRDLTGRQLAALVAGLRAVEPSRRRRVKL